MLGRLCFEDLHQSWFLQIFNKRLFADDQVSSPYRDEHAFKTKSLDVCVCVLVDQSASHLLIFWPICLEWSDFYCLYWFVLIIARLGHLLIISSSDQVCLLSIVCRFVDRLLRTGLALASSCRLVDSKPKPDFFQTSWQRNLSVRKLLFQVETKIAFKFNFSRLLSLFSIVLPNLRVLHTQIFLIDTRSHSPHEKTLSKFWTCRRLAHTSLADTVAMKLEYSICVLVIFEKFCLCSPFSDSRLSRDWLKLDPYQFCANTHKHTALQLCSGGFSMFSKFCFLHCIQFLKKIGCQKTKKCPKTSLRAKILQRKIFTPRFKSYLFIFVRAKFFVSRMNFICLTLVIKCVVRCFKRAMIFVFSHLNSKLFCVLSLSLCSSIFLNKTFRFAVLGANLITRFLSLTLSFQVESSFFCPIFSWFLKWFLSSCVYSSPFVCRPVILLPADFFKILNQANNLLFLQINKTKAVKVISEKSFSYKLFFTNCV